MEMKVGSIVTLKSCKNSNDFKMTVTKIIGENKHLSDADMKIINSKGCKLGDLVCVWNIDNVLNTDVFPPEALVKLS